MARAGFFDFELHQKSIFDPEVNTQGIFDFELATGGKSAALSGTSVPTSTETDEIAGGKTTIITLTGDTWIAAGALNFDAQRQNIINGFLSAQSEALGFNLVPKVLQGVAGVVRTSNTIVTITWDAFPTYSITADETITLTIPATALDGAAAIVAAPTFKITNVSPAGTSSLLSMMGIG